MTDQHENADYESKELTMSDTRTEPTPVGAVASDPIVVDPTTAPIPLATETAASTGAEGDQLVGQLAALAELHRAGSLTDAEFSSAKASLLQAPPSPPSGSRIPIPLPSRRMIPTIHAPSALNTLSLALLDRAARRLGGRCGPVSEPVQIRLDVNSEGTRQTGRFQTTGDNGANGGSGSAIGAD